MSEIERVREVGMSSQAGGKTRIERFGTLVSVFWIVMGWSATTYAAETPAPTGERLPQEVFEQAARGVVVVKVQPAGAPETAPEWITQMHEHLGLYQPKLGSGFVVDEAGAVLTAYHLVQGDRGEIEVILKDGRSFTVTQILGEDPGRDLCLLKIEAHGLHVLPRGNARDLKPGQRVVAIGAPKGLGHSISDGLFSGVRVIDGTSLLQFSAPMTGGYSGGPLLDMQGRVVGVIKRTFDVKDESNLSFAIPVEEVEPFIASRPVSTVSGVPPTTLSSQLSGEDPLALTQRAEQLFVSGDTTEAFRLWQQAIALAPDNPSSRFSLALGYSQMGRHDDARKELQRVLAIDPKFPDAQTALCVSYGTSGLYNHAVSACEKAIADDPKAPRAYVELGVIWLEAGDLKAAEKILSQGRAVNPNSGTILAALGLVLARQGKSSEAMAEARRALTLDPQNAGIHWYAAQTAFLSKAYELAVQHYDEAIRLGASDTDFARQLEPYRKNR